MLRHALIRVAFVLAFVLVATAATPLLAEPTTPALGFSAPVAMATVDVSTAPDVLSVGALDGTISAPEPSGLTGVQVAVTWQDAPTPGTNPTGVDLAAGLETWPAQPEGPWPGSIGWQPNIPAATSVTSDVQVATLRPIGIERAIGTRAPGAPARSAVPFTIQPLPLPPASEREPLPSTTALARITADPNQVTITRQPQVPLQTSAAVLPSEVTTDRPATTQPDRIAAVRPDIKGTGTGDGAETQPAPALIFVTQSAPVSKSVDEPVAIPDARFIQTAAWVVDFPGALLDADGVLAVGELTGDAPDWLSPGSVLQAINGVPVSNLNDWSARMDTLAEATSNGRVTIDLDVVSVDGTLATHNVRLETTRRVTLTNGTIVDLRRKGAKWKATVVGSSQTQTDSIREGDVLLFDFTTREKLASATSFEALLAALDKDGATDVTFAIVRNGALENGSLTLN